MRNALPSTGLIAHRKALEAAAIAIWLVIFIARYAVQGRSRWRCDMASHQQFMGSPSDEPMNCRISAKIP